MRIKMVIYLFIIGIMIAIIPIPTRALESSNSAYNSVYLFNKNDIILAKNNNFLALDIQILDCNSLLGDPTDENSVAWLLQQVFNFVKIIGPILVVVLSSIDFAKVIISSDDEAMGKAGKKLGSRLVLAAMLFFVPLLVEVLLDLFGFTSVCGIN